MTGINEVIAAAAALSVTVAGYFKVEIDKLKIKKKEELIKLKTKQEQEVERVREEARENYAASLYEPEVINENEKRK